MRRKFSINQCSLKSDIGTVHTDSCLSKPNNACTKCGMKLKDSTNFNYLAHGRFLYLDFPPFLVLHMLAGQLLFLPVHLIFLGIRRESIPKDLRHQDNNIIFEATVHFKRSQTHIPACNFTRTNR